MFGTIWGIFQDLTSGIILFVLRVRYPWEDMLVEEASVSNTLLFFTACSAWAWRKLGFAVFFDPPDLHNSYIDHTH